MMTMPEAPGSNPRPAPAVDDERSPLTLRDGTAVAVRPMHEADGDRLVRFHESLSAETQYRRFFSSHAHLSAHEVDWFTHVDHVHREALVATVDDDIVGVGRFDRLPGTSDAEVAFVVADGFQGRGLGTVLMGLVADRAGALGVERLVADTLLHNDRMLAVFHHAGLPTASRFVDGVVNVTLTLPPVHG